MIIILQFVNILNMNYIIIFKYFYFGQIKSLQVLIYRDLRMKHGKHLFIQKTYLFGLKKYSSLNLFIKFIKKN